MSNCANKSDTTKTILFVDDNYGAREFIPPMMEDEADLSLSVLKAWNGVEALEILRGDLRDLIKIVVTDYQMPEMDGIELLKQLQADGWEGKTIMLTGSVAEAKARLKAEGIETDVFSKPMSAREILEKIGIPLKKRRD